MSTLISASLDAIFVSLAETTALSEWLRRQLGRDLMRLAFGVALTQALTDVANEFPGLDLRYFTEMLPKFAGPLLARYLQPGPSLPTADELTQQWLNHLTIDSTIFYGEAFREIATRFLDRLTHHFENQEPLQWISQARRQQSNDAVILRIAAATELSTTSVEALKQGFAELTAALETALQGGGSSSVYTSGGAYIDGNVSTQNFTGRDLTIRNYIVAGLPRLVIDCTSGHSIFLDQHDTFL